MNLIEPLKGYKIYRCYLILKYPTALFLDLLRTVSLNTT